MKSHLLVEDIPEAPTGLIITDPELESKEDNRKGLIYDITDSTVFRWILIIVMLDHIWKRL